GETGAPHRVVVLPALDDDLVPVSEKQLPSCARAYYARPVQPVSWPTQYAADDIEAVFGAGQ
ncbi:hypothetical protein ACIRD0_37400, partial [Streptomyces microflavus]|uniref:hypothetical protein n=1 Tax=Streptomyces microflavus TaxID=1919 RepID=UPI00380B6E65